MLETWRMLMWLAAFATSVWVYASATSHCRGRFVLSLWVGATLAHVGANALDSSSLPGSLDELLDYRDATILLFPAGILAIAPFREAFNALPLGLAVARLGCIPAACCYETPWAALAESGAFALLHCLSNRSRNSTLLVLSGFGAIRLIAEQSGLRIPHERWLVEPHTLALAWICIGIMLRNQIGSASDATDWLTGRNNPALASLALMLFVWLLFPTSAQLAPTPELAFVAASLLAAAVVIWTCAPPLSTFVDRRGLAFTIAGLAVGFGSASLWRHSAALAGFATPLAVESPVLSIEVALAIVVVSPLFEELLYRGRLLDELRRLWGPLPALVLSSALFALSHVEPAAMLVPFLGGLVCGALVLRTGSLALAVGLHAGWNAAAVGGLWLPA